MGMTNRWNRFIYRLWAPVYDSTVDRFFRPGRKRALELLALRSGERVLILGVGTGADLPLLPAGVAATGIDLSREMLAKARPKGNQGPATVRLVEGDAQKLLVEPASFDAVILNLILSVVPEGDTCLHSALDALKPGARLVIFDKFLPEGESISVLRNLLNRFSTLLGTDINRRLSDLMKGCPSLVIHEESSLLNGMYRIILLRKTP